MDPDDRATVRDNNGGARIRAGTYKQASAFHVSVARLYLARMEVEPLVGGRSEKIVSLTKGPALLCSVSWTCPVDRIIECMQDHFYSKTEKRIESAGPCRLIRVQLATSSHG